MKHFPPLNALVWFAITLFYALGFVIPNIFMSAFMSCMIAIIMWVESYKTQVK